MKAIFAAISDGEVEYISQAAGAAVDVSDPGSSDIRLRETAHRQAIHPYLAKLGRGRYPVGQFTRAVILIDGQQIGLINGQRSPLADRRFMGADLRVQRHFVPITAGGEDVDITVKINVDGKDAVNADSRLVDDMLAEVFLPVIIVPGDRIILNAGGQGVHIPITIAV